MQESRSDSSGKPRPARILLTPRVVSGDQKRSSERTTTLRKVPARVEGQDAPALVPLINISPTGLQLSAGQQLEAGTRLLVEVLPGDIRTAIARWVRDADGNYLIGAEWETSLTFEEVWKIRSAPAS